MAMRGRLFSYSVVFSLLCLGVAVLTILSPVSLWASEKDSEVHVFSLDVRDEPLIEVFDKISKLTAYEIEVGEKWAHLPITASIKNASIHEAFNRVLRKFNHTIVLDDLQKKVVVSIYDPGVTPKQQKDRVFTRQKEIDPLDVEVIPPRKPGERGTTQRQLEAMKKSQATIDPLDVEVIPPRKPGERGVTQRQLEEMKKSQPTIAPQVIPPKNPQGGEVRQKQPN